MVLWLRLVWLLVGSSVSLDRASVLPTSVVLPLLFFSSRHLSNPTQSKAAAREALEAVFLTEAGDTAAGTYSGGMKRRLSVAIACTGGPKVICMDEPTTGLGTWVRACLCHYDCCNHRCVAWFAVCLLDLCHRV